MTSFEFTEGSSFHCACKIEGPIPKQISPFEVHLEQSAHLELSELALANHVKAAIVPAIILDKYPSSSIIVQLRVLQGDETPSTLKNLIKATVQALLKAGIEFYDIPTPREIGSYVITVLPALGRICAVTGNSPDGVDAAKLGEIFSCASLEMFVPLEEKIEKESIEEEK
eukprot:gnl/Dysnectes_brevis/2291_a2695_1765.p1 GENE.gnl/Dysnectes_brevis/2291_a2695_1765~~gnl/Dysnectes_brevis/2291_a2695_1765.p1  ORF type:complete len:187 (+),score=27.37 gnl/Dysnectes_brevis/2291_a2695_1765:54-563(+)